MRDHVGVGFDRHQRFAMADPDDQRGSEVKKFFDGVEDFGHRCFGCW